MKKIITTLAMVLMLSTQLHAETAQQGDEHGEFSLRYKVNLARLISTYDNNHEELVKLREFMDGATNNEQRKISRIEIWGYASPDGTSAINDRLSVQRAEDCCKYLRQQYSFLDGVNCQTKGVAQPWSATKSAVESSSMPMKSEVLSAVDSDMSQMKIQQKLKAMPSAWSYLRESILPKMRCVDIVVVQKSAAKPTAKSTACKPEPQCKPAPQIKEVVVNNYYVITKREPSRLIAIDNYDYAPLDFPCTKDRSKVNGYRQKAKLKDRLRKQKYLWRSW